MQRNVFKKQAAAPMQNPIEKKIVKSNKTNSSSSPFATSLMCINHMNVSASKKHVAEAKVLVAVADDPTPVANSQEMQTRKPLYCTCQTDSWKYFYNCKQVHSDSCNIENNLEITIFQLFDNLPLNIA